MAIFAMLGAVMFCLKIIMEVLPNIHPLAMLTMAYTIVYRKKALIPLYVYIILNGIFAGFASWWIPYLYIWTILWGVTMLLPKNMSVKAQYIVYPIICALSGVTFGVLYAPVQALLFGMNFKQMVAWIITGFPWDLMQAAGNFALGFLIVPIANVLKKLG